MARLLLLDMDGTLTSVKSPWQYVHEQIGRWEQDGLPLLEAWLAGRLDYDEFCRLDVETWNAAGLDLAGVQRILDTIPVSASSVNFLRDAAARGFRLAIISTGFLQTARRIMTLASVPEKDWLLAANDLAAPGGALTPIIHVSDSGDRGKASWSRRLRLLCQVAKAETAAIGDGESDRPMFDEAGQYRKIRGPEELGGQEIRSMLGL